MNQADANSETTKSKVDWSTPYDEWLIPILNRARRCGPIEFRALPSEIQLHVEEHYHQQLEAKLAETLESIREEAYRRASFELQAHGPGYIVNPAEVKWGVFEKRLAHLTNNKTTSHEREVE